MTLTDAGAEMSAPLKAIDGNADLPALMTELARNARAAARTLALAPPEQKNRALEAMERAIRANASAILTANAEDVAEVRAGGASSAFIDRLTLTQARIDAMADGIATVREIPDPIGVVTESWQRPNGMTIERVRVPLGVIAVIFESRPNVAADAGVLCLKSGNAVILRGGSDSFHSCRAIHQCLVQGLREAGLPEADRKSTRLNSSHGYISYAVFCLQKKKKKKNNIWMKRQTKKRNKTN